MDWLRHLQDPQARTDFEELLRNSTTVLTRLRDILDEKDRQLTTSEFSTEEFSNPSWAYKEANRIGRRSQLKEIKDLLRFIP